MADDRFIDNFEKLHGPYLLGELSAEEERELERHLEECEGCRRELEHERQTHNLLFELAANEPPVELKEQVLAKVIRDEASAQSSAGGKWWLWASAAAAAVLLVAVLGVGLLLQEITGEPSASVALAATELAPEAGGEAQVEEVGENVQVELEVWGMPELEEDAYYEMWYYAEDDGRISCGTFQVGPEGRTQVTLSAPGDSAHHYPEIEITREPDDGDPAPSGEAVLEGTLRST